MGKATCWTQPLAYLTLKMGENSYNTVNNSIAWIIAYKDYMFTDASFDEFCVKFIQQIPNELGRLNAKTLNEAIRVFPDEFIIALRKALCTHILSISTVQDKTKLHIKKKTKGSTALKEIYELVRLIASGDEPITEVILDEYFFLAGDKFQQKNQELLENLFTNIEEIKINISEIHAKDSEIQKLNNRMDSIDQTLNLIISMLKNPIDNRSAASTEGSNSNPIHLDKMGFPPLPNPSVSFNSIFRNTPNPNQTPNSARKRVRIENDQTNSANLINKISTSSTTRRLNNTSNTNINSNNNNSNNPKSNQASTRNSSQHMRQKGPAQKRLLNYDSTDQNSANTQIREETPWVLKAKKSKAINKTYLKTVGTCVDTSIGIATIKRTYPVYIGRVQNGISNEEIEKFLNQKFKQPIEGLTKLQLNHTHFSSYYFYIDFLEQDLIKNKEIWPHGLIVDRFNRPRSKPVSLHAQPILNNNLASQQPNNSQTSQTSSLPTQNASNSSTFTATNTSTSNSFALLTDENNMDTINPPSSQTTSI